MSTLPTNEFHQFVDFVAQIRDRGVNDLTPEQSVQQFRELQEQEKLRIFQERNAIAQEQTRRGDYRPLDLEALLRRVEDRVAKQGRAK
jgi:hypothetical protein